MTALRAEPALFAPDNAPATFDALAETMATAATYASTAVQFAEIRDARGLAYAIRSASAAILSAATLVEEVRPSRTGASQ